MSEFKRRIRENREDEFCELWLRLNEAWQGVLGANLCKELGMARSDERQFMQGTWYGKECWAPICARNLAWQGVLGANLCKELGKALVKSIRKAWQGFGRGIRWAPKLT